MHQGGSSAGCVLVVWSLLLHLRQAGMSHILCVKDLQLQHAKMCGRSSYWVIMHHWLKTQIGPYAVNLSLSSVVVKLKTIEEWDLASRYSWLPSQCGGLAWWSLSYPITYSMSSLCISALFCTLPRQSFVLNMFTFAQKYSMSGRAKTSMLPVNIFPISTK